MKLAKPNYIEVNGGGGGGGGLGQGQCTPYSGSYREALCLFDPCSM